MSYDALLMFSDKQALTTTATSTNTLDLGAPSINPRTGQPFKMIYGAASKDDYAISVKISDAIVGATSLDVQLQGSHDNSSFSVIGTTGPIPVAELKAGYEFGFNGLPVRARHRYVRANYVLVGTATAGTITAGFSDGIQTAGTL